MNPSLSIRAVVALGLVSATRVVGDVVSAESLVKNNTFNVAVHVGELTGPGADLLRQEADAAQFVILGEPHNSNDVPKFTSALFRMLQRESGYEVLALEEGPSIVARLAAVAQSGGATKLLDVARLNASALHFRTAEELTMMADIVSEASQGSNALWGLDRELDPKHVLEQIASSNESNASATASELLRRARQHDSSHLDSQRFMVAYSDEVEEFGLRWRDNPGKVGSLADLLYRSAHNISLFGKGDEESRRQATHDREELLKEHFTNRYYTLSGIRDRPPKTIIKLGHQHCEKTRATSGFESFGAYLDSWASKSGTRGFYINIQIMNPPGKYWSLTQYPEYKLLSDAGSFEEWRLVDLRPLRQALSTGGIELNDTLSNFVSDFDCVLLLGGADRGSMDWLHP